MEEHALKAMFAHINGLNILPMYWPNVDAETPTENHIRVAVKPTTPDKLGICDGSSKYTWILQASIYVKEGIGQIVPAQYADILRTGIPVLTELSSGGFTFRTEKQGEVIPSVQSADAWYFVPVQFQVSIFN